VLHICVITLHGFSSSCMCLLYLKKNSKCADVFVISSPSFSRYLNDSIAIACPRSLTKHWGLYENNHILITVVFLPYYTPVKRSHITKSGKYFNASVCSPFRVICVLYSTACNVVLNMFFVTASSQKYYQKWLRMEA
jgi:hypothetical protein